MPVSNLLAITAAGVYTLDPSTSLVTVNVAGSISVILPSAVTPASAQAQPGLFVQNPITIVDIGGHAAAFPITIFPKGTDNIIGLTFVNLSVNFGGYTLKPSSILRGWNIISP